MPGWCIPFAVLAGYAALGVLLHSHHFGEGLKAEDSHWIRGDYFGTPLRLTQHLLLHRICFPLFADSLNAYYVLTLGLHVINAGLVCTLYGVLARGLRGARPRLGGLLAGLLFLCYDSNNLSYVSAISYQLVVLFLLCGTWCMLSYLERGRRWTWAGALVAYGLALLTNVYALAFPLIWIALEVAWRKGAGNQPRGSPLQRYALMLVPLGLLLLVHGAFLWGYDGLLAVRADPWWRTAAQLPVYVMHAAASFFAGLFGLDLESTMPSWLAAAPVLGLTAWGAWQVLGKKQNVGLPAVGALLVVLWSGLVFFQALAAQDGFSGDWRHYYNAAGMALAVAWLVIWLLNRATAALGSGRGRAVELAAVVLVMLAVVAGNPGTRRWWDAAGDEARAPHGRQAQECSTLVRLEQQEAATLLSPGADLRCRDLRGLDLARASLAGADLRGTSLALCNLARARLARARLSSAYLLWAHLDDADMSGAGLHGANLFGASLRSARLSGARLSSARLVGARLQGAVMTGAEMRDADLSGARLAGADLSDADLSRAMLIKSDLKKSSLGRANLTRANLMQADLRGSRLDGAVLLGADLQGAVICQRYRGVLKGYRGTPSWVRCPR